MKKQAWISLFVVAVISLTPLCLGLGKSRTETDLLTIASAGGGMILDASGKTTTELIDLAAVTATAGGTLTLQNVGGFTTSDLVRIAAAGSTHVIFQF